MKKKSACALILLTYCVPWTYFALRADAVGGTMLMYGIMLLMHSLLCALSVKMRCAWAAAAGSALSGAVSLVCVKLSSLAEMNYFFKPFTALQLAAAVSVVLFAVQAGAAAWTVRKKKPRDC